MKEPMIPGFIASSICFLMILFSDFKLHLDLPGIYAEILTVFSLSAFAHHLVSLESLNP